MLWETPRSRRLCSGRCWPQRILCSGWSCGWTRRLRCKTTWWRLNLWWSLWLAPESLLHWWICWIFKRNCSVIALPPFFFWCWTRLKRCTGYRLLWSRVIRLKRRECSATCRCSHGNSTWIHRICINWDLFCWRFPWPCASFMLGSLPQGNPRNFPWELRDSPKNLHSSYEPQSPFKGTASLW